METLLLLIILVLGIKFLIKWISKYKHFGNILNRNNLFMFLLVWIIFGFVEGLDYSERFGCIVESEPIFEINNVLSSGISFLLILWAFLTKNHKLKKVLFITELVYWILKLMIFKGGYVVGFGGIPDDVILFFDLISILVRLYILNKIIKFDLVKIEYIALLLIGIKIIFFYIPIYDMYLNKIEIKKTKKVRKEIIGEWIGKISLVEDNEIKFVKIRNVKIDSANIKIDSIEGWNKQYELILNHSNLGTLIGKSEEILFKISMNEHKDSLILRFGNTFNGYKFELKKKENES